MERLKVSMITICYNAEKTIAKTIESVLSQDYENLEYIIVDGGSKDHTIDIIKSYENEKIRWISENDNGISDAFNKGIKMAIGDFIGLINADDYLLPHAIANLLLACHEEADVLYENTIVNDEENELKLVKHAGSVEGLEYSLPFIHQSSLVRKKFMSDMEGIQKNIKYAWIMICLQGFIGKQNFNLSIQLLVASRMVEHRVDIRFRQSRKIYPLRKSMA